MNIYSKNGSLEIICGPMFSGKTEELIRRIKRLFYAKKKVKIFKHSFDDRYDLKNKICTHCKETMDAVAIKNSIDIFNFINDDIDVVCIDEVQFFDNDVVVNIDKLVRMGKRVIAAGLDLDFRGIPFGPMPYLLAMADEVTKLKSICFKSGADAIFNQRIINGKPASSADSTILVGGAERYEARSRECFEIDEVPIEEYIKNINKSK